MSLLAVSRHFVCTQFVLLLLFLYYNKGQHKRLLSHHPSKAQPEQVLNFKITAASSLMRFFICTCHQLHSQTGDIHLQRHVKLGYYGNTFSSKI